MADAYRLNFALRKVLVSVSDLIAVEQRVPSADEPSVVLGTDCSVVLLADVSSVTLDHDSAALQNLDGLASNLALSLGVALANVGQSNLAAQLATATAAASTVIADPEVSFTIAGAMFRSRRVREAVELADALDASEQEDVRLGAAALLGVLLARGKRLSDVERRLALDCAERRLERREARGDMPGAAAEAYSLAMMLKGHNDAAAIASFRRAAELDPHYLDRAYYHADFAGVLFEHGDYDDAAAHYGRAVELGSTGLPEALHADALLWAGRYREAEERFDGYLQVDRGVDDAEWRLKRAIIPLLRERAGDREERDPDAAARLIAPVDFETAVDLSVDEAWSMLDQALARDACCAEAWLRLAFLQTAAAENLTAGAASSLAAAVLHRHAVGAWINALIGALDADDSCLIDLLHTGYRFNGMDFVDQVVATADQQNVPGVGARLVELLDRAVHAWDDRERHPGFILRFNSDDGTVREFIFGEDLEPTA